MACLGQVLACVVALLLRADVTAGSSCAAAAAAAGATGSASRGCGRVVEDASHAYADAVCASMPHVRPARAQRQFVSSAVEKLIDELAPRILSPDLATLWSNCLPNTLDTTIHADASATDAFVVTGDIEAMWLRDSTNQVLPYVAMAAEDERLLALLSGVIRRQARSVLIDAYANAFTLRATDRSPHADDHTSRPAFAGTRRSGLAAGVYERKYELDSLAHVLLLAGRFYEQTKSLEPFDGDWLPAVQRIVDVMETQRQQVTGHGAADYTFQRAALNPTDTLSHGQMWPNRHTGLIRSAFRPSDDATVYPYHIPANALAVVALRSVSAPLLVLGQAELHAKCLEMAAQVEDAILKHGVVEHAAAGSKVFAYEVDGFGNFVFMDDANVPSLLSLPVFGFVAANDTTYRATRALLLSADTNPYFFVGAAGRGIGGPHNGVNFIWPMAVMTQAWTSASDGEIGQLLELLVNASACTGLMHESFHSDSVYAYTRPWFAWANSLFGDLILKIARERPHLILKG